MADVITTFKRKEKKYLLTGAGYEAIMKKLEGHMKEDEYGLTPIISIYYDNDDFRLIHRSIEKPRYKEKFRIRSYGIPDEDTVVFAEIKKKYDGIVYKRRTAAPLKEMREFLKTGAPLKEQPQIQREIRWMFERYDLKPKILISCKRLALYGIEDPSLRITFDSDLRYRTRDLDLSIEGGEPFEPEDFHIMEIKFPGSSPLWLNEILDELHILPGSFSKVGTCFRTKVFPELTQKKPASETEI